MSSNDRVMGRINTDPRVLLTRLAACLAGGVVLAIMVGKQEGTLTNFEGRVIRRRRVARPPSGVRGDIDILRELAERLGHGNKFAFRSSREVFDGVSMRIVRLPLTAQFSSATGVSGERAREIEPSPRSGDMTISPSTRPRSASSIADISSASLCEPDTRM